MATNRMDTSDVQLISRWKAIFYKILSNVDPSLYMVLLMGMLVVVIVTPSWPSPTLRWFNEALDASPLAFIGIPQWVLVAALVGFAFIIARVRPLPFETFMFSVPAGIFGLMTIAYAVNQSYTPDVIVWIVFGYVAIFIMNFSVMSAQNHERENKQLTEQIKSMALDEESKSLEMRQLNLELGELKEKLKAMNLDQKSEI